MQLQNILVISGKPDLNELVSRNRGGAIVENIVTGQRMPVFQNDRISALAEKNIKAKQDSKPIDFDPKKADGKMLFDYFGQILPDYDTERVHASDVKKVLHWYNILLAAGKLEDEPAEETTTESK